MSTKSGNDTEDKSTTSQKLTGKTYYVPEFSVAVTADSVSAAVQKASKLAKSGDKEEGNK